MDSHSGIQLLSWTEDAETLAWKSRANCRGQPLEVFFGGDYSKARAICAECTVVSECDAYNEAFETEFDWRSGFYAGKSARDRDLERKRLRSANYAPE